MSLTSSGWPAERAQKTDLREKASDVDAVDKVLMFVGTCVWNWATKRRELTCQREDVRSDAPVVPDLASALRLCPDGLQIGQGDMAAPGPGVKCRSVKRTPGRESDSSYVPFVVFFLTTHNLDDALSESRIN